VVLNGLDLEARAPNVSLQFHFKQAARPLLGRKLIFRRGSAGRSMSNPVDGSDDQPGIVIGIAADWLSIYGYFNGLLIRVLDFENFVGKQPGLFALVFDKAQVEHAGYCEYGVRKVDEVLVVNLELGDLSLK
jgi:hypothetical protein